VNRAYDDLMALLAMPPLLKPIKPISGQAGVA